MCVNHTCSLDCCSHCAQGSPPSCECPYERAGVYARARLGEGVKSRRTQGSGKVVHDQELAAAIAGAWLELPGEVRAKGWPSLSESSGDDFEIIRV